MPKYMLWFAFMQVEATIVEEEHEDLSYEEPVQDDQDTMCELQPLAAASTKAVSTLNTSFMQPCLTFSSFSVHY